MTLDELEIYLSKAEAFLNSDASGTFNEVDITIDYVPHLIAIARASFRLKADGGIFDEAHTLAEANWFEAMKAFEDAK